MNNSANKIGAKLKQRRRGDATPIEQLSIVVSEEVRKRDEQIKKLTDLCEVFVAEIVALKHRVGELENSHADAAEKEESRSTTLFDDALTPEEVSRFTGCAKSTVYKWLNNSVKGLGSELINSCALTIRS